MGTETNVTLMADDCVRTRRLNDMGDMGIDTRVCPVASVCQERANINCGHKI